MPPILCHTCREPTPPHDMIHYGSIEISYRDLCSRCFNEEVAREGGLNFEHVRFDPVKMTDVAGAFHEFHFRLHLLGDRVSMEDFELKRGRARGGSLCIDGAAHHPHAPGAIRSSPQGRGRRIWTGDCGLSKLYK